MNWSSLAAPVAITRTAGGAVTGSETLTRGGNMKLTQPTEWFLHGGGIDAEVGGSDGN
jgi:hypothetical protein